MFVVFLFVYGIALIIDFQYAPFTNPQTKHIALEIIIIAYISGLTIEELYQVC